LASYYGKSIYSDYENLLKTNDILKKKLGTAEYLRNLEKKRLENLLSQQDELKKENLEMKQKISDLERECERLNGRLNIDGTNSHLPTSQTPIQKKKVIPNSREKTNRNIGGQPGHAKNKLEKFRDDEISFNIEHSLEKCPECGDIDLEKIDEVTKDELDYKIIVEKNRHHFNIYKCKCCNKEVREKIPNNLKEDNQYGPQVQAQALTLMNLGNVPINKVRKIIAGFSGGDIKLSEGFISKLQKKSSEILYEFGNELRQELLKQSMVYWDDTVIMVNQKRSCLRFYGDEKLAIYKAHPQKNKEGLDDDNILKLLDKEVIVVHDHNKVNYNKDYIFRNAECCQHLLRDLKKISDNLNHDWSKELVALLKDTNTARKKNIEENVNKFTPEETAVFFDSFNDIMLKAFKENAEDQNKYYSDSEETLIKRILDYKNEYLLWVLDFEVPFTNNLSERNLRGVKSKMKISGQFQNIKSARYYADIRSYIETCNKNGINEFEALLMLSIGEPYSLADILAYPKNQLS